METKFNVFKAKKILVELKILKFASDSMTADKATGNGSGDIADELTELSGATTQINESINSLLGSTIDFLSNYMLQMQAVEDEAATAMSED